MIRFFPLILAAATVGLVIVGGLPANAQTDSYEQYVKTSRDFQRVKQDEQFAYTAWPGWIYMPWYYKWKLGFGDEAGEFQVQHGYNGALVDGSMIRADGGYTGGFKDHLDWLNKFRLRFYMDHTAGKRDLHLWDGNQYGAKQRDMASGTGMPRSSKQKECRLRSSSSAR